MTIKETIKESIAWAEQFRYNPDAVLDQRIGRPPKLEEDDIPLIWELMLYLPDSEIGKKFGVSGGAINNIWRRKSWCDYKPNLDLVARIKIERDKRWRGADIKNLKYD